MRVRHRRLQDAHLLRPRFYTVVKLNTERVDPPSSVMAPLLAWAEDAHWSGGLSFKGTRFHNRIEGSVKRLRAQKEDHARMFFTPPRKSSVVVEKSPAIGYEDHGVEEEVAVEGPTLAELFRGGKRMQDTGSLPDGSVNRRKRVRKLGDEFDRIAAETGIGMAGEVVGAISARTQSRKVAVVEVETSPAKEVVESRFVVAA